MNILIPSPLSNSISSALTHDTYRKKAVGELLPLVREDSTTQADRQLLLQLRVPVHLHGDSLQSGIFANALNIADGQTDLG